MNKTQAIAHTIYQSKEFCLSYTLLSISVLGFHTPLYRAIPTSDYYRDRRYYDSWPHITVILSTIL